MRRRKTTGSVLSCIAAHLSAVVVHLQTFCKIFAADSTCGDGLRAWQVVMCVLGIGACVCARRWNTRFERIVASLSCLQVCIAITLEGTTYA